MMEHPAPAFSKGASHPYPRDLLLLFLNGLAISERFAPLLLMVLVRAFRELYPRWPHRWNETLAD